MGCNKVVKGTLQELKTNFQQNFICSKNPSINLKQRFFFG